MSGRPDHGPGLLLEVTGAALAGGALAAVVLAIFRQIDNRALIAGFVLAATAFCVLAVATLSPAAERPSAPRGDHRPASRSPWPDSGQPASGWPASQAGADAPPVASAQAVPATRWSSPAQAPPDPGPPPLSFALPVPGGEWWTAAASGGTPVPPAAPRRDTATTPAPDLADYTATTRVVQCPRCGDFAVDVRRQEPGFAFGCRRCEHRWRWAPGSAWPVSVVRPRLRNRLPAGPGSAPS